jgi:hypothetical protein
VASACVTAIAGPPGRVRITTIEANKIARRITTTIWATKDLGKCVVDFESDNFLGMPKTQKK